MPRSKAASATVTRTEPDPYLATLEALPANVMIAGLDRVITYANPKTVATLAGLMADIRQVAPDFDLDRLIGTSIDIFHGQRAGMIAGLLADPANLPHDGHIRMGNARLHLRVSGIFDANGALGAYALQWDDETDLLRTKATVEETLANAAAVNQVIESVNGADTADAAVRAALETVRKAFGWAYGSFWAVDKDSQTLRWRLDSGSVNSEFLTVTQEASFARGVGLSGRTWAAMDLFFVEDLGEMTDCVRAPVAQRAGVKSGVCFPIVVEGTFVGTMDFFAMETLQPSPERLDALRNVGRLVSAAIGRLEAGERQAEAAANTAAVNQVLQAVSGATSVDEVVRLALDTVRQAFGWAYGSYWTLDEQGQALKWRLDSGVVNSEFLKVTQEASFARGVGLSGRTWAAMDLFFVEDLGQMTDCVRAPVAQRAGVKSGICFPIVVDGGMTGTMDFFAMETLRPSAERLDALRNVGRLVGSAIGRIQNLQRQLKLAESMAVQGREIGQAASGLKESTLEQLASVNETTAAVAEITQIARESVSRSEDVIRQAEEASATYQQGRESLDATLTSMNEIKRQMETIATTIVDLSERTQAIGDIIASVKDIAEQSNLLALNASIEAARAGDQGRGFAVVATEMRSLADQSKQAANQVRSILGEIQNAANAAVRVAEAGGDLVVRGVEQATVSGRHVEALAETIDKSSRAAQQIAASTRQQEVGMDQISEAINSVKEAAVASQAASEQLNRNADEFMAIAGELQSGIGQTS